VTSAKRNPQLPEVPTMIESGIQDFVLTFWTGIIAPAGTPQTAINAVNIAVVNGLKTDGVRETLSRVGAEAAPGTPQDFAAFIASETEKWSSIAKTAGVQPE
jgi:tripartite-type tricarboxylate transporter receptor subunit TctC